MHYFLHYLAIALLLNLTINCLAQESEKKVEQPVLSPEQIFLASLAEGKVMAYFNQYWQPTNEATPQGYYRKIVKIVNNHEFMVQDFFVDSNHKQSDPYMLTSIYELKRAGVLSSIIGPYVSWYDNGQQQYQLHYAPAGVLDGTMLSWYENGQAKLTGTYKQGKKKGDWQEWYENGHIKSKASYRANKLDGNYEQWYENGQAAVSGVYSKGVLEGKWITWDNTGEKLAEGNYLANKRTGQWTYFVAGKKWAEGSYMNGVQEGMWIYWNKEGSKDKEVFYENGQEVKK